MPSFHGTQRYDSLIKSGPRDAGSIGVQLSGALGTNQITFEEGAWRALRRVIEGVEPGQPAERPA